ncbi:AK7 [Symbiodinium pilosum]|uniref:AK7 protein n=1 Tax=Symbiodinium pilosum TaxID=2952 RepID=A0A812JS95_SYMPI|nr:AK7 [Symbiodinium pilosum]
MEDLVFSCFNREGSQVKGFVVAGGVLYGEGESIFVEMFKDAWRGVQSHVVVTPGVNKVPTVHVRDMARVVRQVITNAEGINPLEATPYFLAVDQPPAAKEGQPSMPAAQAEIVQAIVDEMGEHYDVPRVPKASIAEGGMSDLQEAMALDLWIEPSGIALAEDFCSSLEPPGWVCKNGLLANLRTIADEFCAGKKLRSMRILIAGPPNSGKTNLAQAVAEHFKVPHLSLPEEVTSADLDKTITQISSSVCHFRGYVLDAGGIGFAEAEKLFRYDIEVPKSEEEQEEVPEGADPAPPKIERRLNEETCPAMVIITQAPAAICKARWQSSGASLEAFEKSMQAYISNNLTQNVHSLQDFFQDVANKGVLNLPITGKDDEDMFESARIYIERNGRPFNYLTPEAEVSREIRERRAEKEKAAAEAEESLKQKDDGSAEKREEQRHAARLRIVSDHEAAQQKLRQLPLREYLMQYMVPNLTEGLVEVCKVLPDDPVDYLANYLEEHAARTVALKR